MKILPQREYLEVIGTKVREVLYGGRNWRLGESGAAARKWNRWLQVAMEGCLGERDRQRGIGGELKRTVKFI